MHLDKNISEIAACCGFADASHLGCEFRRAYGMPPSAYREHQAPGALRRDSGTGRACDHARRAVPESERGLLNRNPPGRHSCRKPGGMTRHASVRRRQNTCAPSPQLPRSLSCRAR
ncbi:helix-turn-helix domain-containing protein [Burkholderia ambifaria]|uniref:helix-turn-helix domain-containing protein n=1 Tax=Burkholderia ambifaria TaxID=152480 RepID=UPI002FE0840A